MAFATERPVGPACLEKMDRGRGQAAELDLPGHLFDEFAALLLGRLDREAHATLVEGCGAVVWAIAASNA
jgi:hypothetical protein